MTHIVRATRLAVCATLATTMYVAGCATVDTRTARVVDVAPYARVQECLRATAGQRLHYRFEASAEVQFALQYRDGGATVAPVTREAIRELMTRPYAME